MSFSSLQLYVQTIIPWFAILFVMVFLVLLIAGLSTKKLEDIMTSKFAWAVVGILIIIFLIAAIKVFNPVLHPDLIVTSGEGEAGIVEQIANFLGNSKVAGSILLIIVAVVVSWIITKNS